MIITILLLSALLCAKKYLLGNDGFRFIFVPLYASRTVRTPVIDFYV